jgi:hypothetical protein
MKAIIWTVLLFLLCSNLRAQNDTIKILTAFYGIDNYLPITVYCPGAGAVDGLVLVFSHKIDLSSLDAGDFQIISLDSTVYTPDCAMLTPAGESNELSTVLLVGEFGTTQINEPVSVQVIGDLLTLPNDSLDLSRCLSIQNYNGYNIDTVIHLSSGPLLAYASSLHLSNAQLGVPGSSGTPGNSIGGGCPTGTQQVVQVAWTGGVTPFISGMSESALKDYYTIQVDSAGVFIPYKPSSIADLDDNDNYHDLCMDVQYTPLKVSFEAGFVEDPNGDPNPFTEIDLSRCDTTTIIASGSRYAQEKIQIYPIPANEYLNVQLTEDTKRIEIFSSSTILIDKFEEFMAGGVHQINCNNLPNGIYYLRIFHKNEVVIKMFVVGLN